MVSKNKKETPCHRNGINVIYGCRIVRDGTVCRYAFGLFAVSTQVNGINKKRNEYSKSFEMVLFGTPRIKSMSFDVIFVIWKWLRRHSEVRSFSD